MAISIKLKKRWDAYPTLEDVLAATQNLSVSPFGLTEEGLQDFRGIKLEYQKDSNYLVKYRVNAVPYRADFSGSIWTNVVLDSKDQEQPFTVSECVFDESKFHNSLSSSRATFSDCFFHSCLFKYCYFFGNLNNCRFTGMKKNNVKLFFICDLIKDCLFEGEMRRINFEGSTLEDCTFKGIVYDCMFSGLKEPTIEQLQGYVGPDEVDNRFNNIDFSEADVILTGFNIFSYLDRVKPSPKNCLVHLTEDFVAEFRRLVKEKADDPEEMLRWSGSSVFVHPQNPYRFYHPEDFIRYQSPEFCQQFYDFICQAAETTHTRIK